MAEGSEKALGNGVLERPVYKWEQHMAYAGCCSVLCACAILNYTHEWLDERSKG